MKYEEVLNDVLRIKIFNTLNKGVFMHNYKIDDEITNKVISTYESKKSNAEIDKLVEDIKRANTTFDTADIPDYVEPVFERMPELNKTKEEIEYEAKEMLKDYKNSSIDKIETEFAEGVNKVNNKKAEAINSKVEKEESVSNYFENARKSVSENAINNGLVRSSIVINQFEAFDKDEIDAFNAIDKELSDSINALDFELSSLNLQKKKAMEKFDISYAVKLSDKINQLNEDLLNEQNKVLKYNNEIAEKEKKYLDNYNKLVADIKDKNINNDIKMVDLIAKYGQKAVDTYKKNKIYSVLDGYFANMHNDEIKNVINNNTDLKSALGGYLQDVLDRYN